MEISLEVERINSKIEELNDLIEGLATEGAELKGYVKEKVELLLVILKEYLTEQNLTKLQDDYVSLINDLLKEILKLFQLKEEINKDTNWVSIAAYAAAAAGVASTKACRITKMDANLM